MNPPIRVFLTGATGFLGHYVLSELLSRANVICRVLIRRADAEAAAELATLLAPLGVDVSRHLAAGRIEWANGALPENVRSTDLSGVDRIIHTAANTRFDALGEEPHRTNVLGTQALLDAAASARIRHFVHVSTAYAGGPRRGSVAERVAEAPDPSANDYECSKWRAERIVRAWAVADRHAVIVRPSILMGDARTGRATRFGGVYLLARSVALMARAVAQDTGCNRHAIPLRIMGDPAVRPNLVPVCWAARRVAKVALAETPVNRVYNLTQPQPPTAAEIKAWLEPYFDVAGGEFTDRIWPWAEPSRYEEAFYAVGPSVLDYFNRHLNFEMNGVDPTDLPPRVDRDYFIRCLDYAVLHDWGRRPGGPRSDAHRRQDSPDPVWYFETHLVRHASASSVARVAGLTDAVRFEIEGAGGGTWVCRYEAGRLVEVTRGAVEGAAPFGFRVRRPAFDAIVRGTTRLQDAYFAGDAELVGNVLMALKMVPIIERFVREFPLRPAAA